MTRAVGILLLALTVLAQGIRLWHQGTLIQRLHEHGATVLDRQERLSATVETLKDMVLALERQLRWVEPAQPGRLQVRPPTAIPL